MTRRLLVIVGLAAVVLAGVLVLRAGGEELGPVRQSTLPWYPSRGAAIGDRELLEKALDDWRAAYDAPDEQEDAPTDDIEALWAGPHGDGRLVVLHDGADVATVRYSSEADDARSVAVALLDPDAPAMRAGGSDAWLLSTFMPGRLEEVELEAAAAAGRTRPARVTDGLLTIQEVNRTAVVPPADTTPADMVEFLVGSSKDDFVVPVLAAGEIWPELRGALTNPETARATHAALAEGAAAHADELLSGGIPPDLKVEVAWRGRRTAGGASR